MDTYAIILPVFIFAWKKNTSGYGLKYKPYKISGNMVHAVRLERVEPGISLFGMHYAF